jgi:hypothetical protein
MGGEGGRGGSLFYLAQPGLKKLGVEMVTRNDFFSTVRLKLNVMHHFQLRNLLFWKEKHNFFQFTFFNEENLVIREHNDVF